jgi:hypothetical protein
MIKVSLINGAPLVAHNREHDWYISFITLCRGCTLPTSCDSLSARRELLPIDDYLGGLAGYHYEAFTKIPRGCSHPLGFLNVPHSSPRGNPPSAERAAYTEPHWRHCFPIPASWLHCFPEWSSNKQVLTERHSRNRSSPLKCHNIIFIIKRGKQRIINNLIIFID